MDYQAWRLYFEQLVRKPEADINLAEAALVLASDEYPTLDVARYLAQLDAMANALAARLPPQRDPQATVRVLNDYLFRELHFVGNQWDYYDPRNSYLNDVLERRTGLPITLSLVYLELAKRTQLPIYGVGLPGHFIVKWQDERTRILIDAFDRGAVLDERAVEAKVRETFDPQARFQPEWLKAVGAKYILTRMLYNLKAAFLYRDNYARAWQVVDKLLILDPRSADNIRDMGLISLRIGAYRQAATFLEEYLLSHADAPDATEMHLYLRTALRYIERLN